MGSSLCSTEGRQQPPQPAVPAPSASSRGSQLVCETPEQQAVAAGLGRDIDIVDCQTGKRSCQLIGHCGPVTCLLASNGVLFSGSVDGTVRRWSTRRGTILQTMEGHTGPVWCLATADRRVFSGGEDCSIRQWDARNGDVLDVFTDHEHRVICLLADGSFLYSGSEDRTLRQWDLKAGVLCRTLQHSAPVSSLLAYSGSIFAGGRDATIRRWSPETGVLEATLAGGSRPPRRRVQVHNPDLEAHDELAQSRDIAHAEGEREDAECTKEQLEDNEKKEEEHKADTKDMGEEICIMSLFGASGLLFSGCRDGTIAKWDLARNQLLARLGGLDKHELGVTCFLQDNDMILSGSADGTVRMWETDSGELCNVLEGGWGVTCLMRTSGGIIFGGQARGSPQRLPPLMRRRWWKEGRYSGEDGQVATAALARQLKAETAEENSAIVRGEASKVSPESLRKFL